MLSVLTNAKDFYTLVVEPTVNEFIDAPNNIRRGLLAVLVLNHMIDHLAQENETASDRRAMDKRVKEVRNEILVQCPDFQFIWDMADSTKHAKLAKTAREVSSSSQITRTPGIFEAPFGQGAFAEAIEVFAVLDDGTKKSLLPVVKSVFSCFKCKVNESSVLA